MKRVALVTGGNRGIGLATVDLLALKGFRVLMGCRDLAQASAIVKPLKARGLDVDPIALDVSHELDADHAQRLISSHIDVLVNNAGVYPRGDALHVSEQAFREALEVHVLGPWRLCRLLMPSMQLRGWGRIVNVSSGYGSFAEGLEGPLAYSVSKAALNTLTVKLAREAGTEVKVNAICPGWVKTRMGGAEAPVAPATAAEHIVWLATLPSDGPTGGLFRERHQIEF